MLKEKSKYTNSLLDYSRYLTREVYIGDKAIGGTNPIRIQSMTTTDTMDTEGTIEQTLRMVESGAEYVRITAPSKKEAENLRAIKEGLRKRGCEVPLIADIHFTPNAAEIAARIVEKVRVNPGNYADKKKFAAIEYSDETYASELERIYERFSPLVKICKEEGTTMRIGTNHGSLSDRIMSRYGDTPHGMVESAMEFIRICEDHNFHDIVISMKASNPQVMVQAYRMLCATMMEREHRYPLHLGVTEAGEGEDGRIKSALGISSLLMDGIGDTVRVSLTEEPEFESPVAQFLVDMVSHTPAQDSGHRTQDPPFDPYNFKRRPSIKVRKVGDSQVPVVVADLSQGELTQQRLTVAGYKYNEASDKFDFSDTSADMIYLGDNIPAFELPGGATVIYNSDTWKNLSSKGNTVPYFHSTEQYKSAEHKHVAMNLVSWDGESIEDETVVWVLNSNGNESGRQWRRQAFELINSGNKNPFILRTSVPEQFDFYSDESVPEKYRIEKVAKPQLWLGAMCSSMVVDGMIDGIWVEKTDETKMRAMFGILQLGRLRTTRTEYISCPSCGRTLFDLQETTAMIRQHTEHLKGVKIGIMGCIVNGPGEMADADYGYVGVGPDKISLYRGQEVVEKGVPTAVAVEKLIGLIREDGNWVEP